MDFTTRILRVAELRNTAAVTRYCLLFITRLIYHVFIVLLFAAEAGLDLFHVRVWPAARVPRGRTLQWELLGASINAREI